VQSDLRREEEGSLLQEFGLPVKKGGLSLTKDKNGRLPMGKMLDYVKKFGSHLDP